MNLYKQILHSGSHKDDNYLSSYRKKTVNITVLYGVPVLLIFSMINFKIGINSFAYVDILAALTLFLSFIYLKYSKKVFMPSIGVLLAFYFIHLGSLFNAGVANSSFFWFFAFPPLSIYFFGIKRGLYLIYGLLLTIFIFFIYVNIVEVNLTYDVRLLIVLMLALFLLTKINVFYEGLRENYEKTIIEQKEKIEKQKVTLEELNKSLEDKVKEEVEKNRKKDKQLLQQSRLAQMGEMISMIAHQWRQPLTAISSTANTLTLDIIMDNYNKEFFQEQVDNIANYSQHLSLTIDDFRNFFKNNKEKQDITLEEIVKSTLSIIKTSLDNKQISLITDFNCHKNINTYPNELKQVVLNLIKNAEDVLIEKNIENPQIKIKTYAKNDKCYLIVEDNAGGIPKNIIDKIFDPYFSTKKAKDGTGLGLYMSKTIVQEHCQGLLNVENTKFGAVFKIEL